LHFVKIMNQGLHRYIGEPNRLYLKKEAIWALDHTYDGFKWVDCKSENKCVFGCTRTDGKVTVLLNTDWESFGGRTTRVIRKSIPGTIPAFGGILLSYSLN